MKTQPPPTEHEPDAERDRTNPPALYRRHRLTFLGNASECALCKMGDDDYLRLEECTATDAQREAYDALPAPHADLKLSTGRTARHMRLPNGAQWVALAEERGEMTEPEWEEYCATYLPTIAKGGNRAH